MPETEITATKRAADIRGRELWEQQRSLCDGFDAKPRWQTFVYYLVLAENEEKETLNHDRRVFKTWKWVLHFAPQVPSSWRQWVFWLHAWNKVSRDFFKFPSVLLRPCCRSWALNFASKVTKVVLVWRLSRWISIINLLFERRTSGGVKLWVYPSPPSPL